MDAWIQELAKQGVLGVLIAALVCLIYSGWKSFMSNVAQPMVTSHKEFLDATVRNQEASVRTQEQQAQAVDKISDTLRVMEGRQQEHINICRGQQHA